MKKIKLVFVDFILNLLITVYGLTKLLQPNLLAQAGEIDAYFYFILAFLGIFLMVIDLIYGIGRRKKDTHISISGELVTISLLVKVMMLVIILIATIAGVNWSDLFSGI